MDAVKLKRGGKRLPITQEKFNDIKQAVTLGFNYRAIISRFKIAHSTFAYIKKSDDYAAYREMRKADRTKQKLKQVKQLVEVKTTDKYTELTELRKLVDERFNALDAKLSESNKQLSNLVQQINGVRLWLSNNFIQIMKKSLMEPPKDEAHHDIFSLPETKKKKNFFSIAKKEN